MKGGVAMAEGFIKLYRQFMEWEWYHDTNTMVLFLHCLLKANHKDKKWQGITIERGSFITSYGNLAKELRFSVRSVRTALEHLKSTNELTIKTTNKYTLINVVKWANYQSNDNDNDTQTDKQKDKRPTSNRQATDKQPTTTKNEKNVKNEENDKKKDIKHKHGIYSHVLLTDSEYSRLKNDFPDIEERIQRLDDYIQMKGAKYKDHNLTIRTWAKKDSQPQQGKPKDVEVDWLHDYIEKMEA